MRLIDADTLIEKMSTVMDMQDVYLPIHFKEWLIDEAPTIDIVKCGECKFWAGHSIGNLDDWAECRWREDEATDADDFCSYGERREP